MILCILSLLRDPQYGYSLVSGLEESGIPIEAGTLYPLLRRLEKQGLLDSEWDIDQTRPRRYYVLNPNGHDMLNRLTQEWRVMTSAIETMMDQGISD